MGKLAQSFMERLKRRRNEMELSLSRHAVVFLNACLREQYKLPLGSVGMSQHYQAKDIRTLKQVRQLKKWLEEVVMDKTIDAKDHESWVIRDVWNGRLTNAYVDTIKEVVAHYKACGMTAQFAEGYTDLDAALKGEKLNIDSLDEMAGPAPVAPAEEAKKAAS